MGYEAAGMLIMLIIIFSVVWYVGEICSVLGIVFGCISSSNSKKYVNTKGLSNFKTVKNYHTAATVFMIISSVIIALWLVFWIWLGIVSGENKNNSGTVLNAANDGYFDWAVDFFASSITMLAVHIGSVIAGIVAQVKYKNAKELHEDILSGKVVPPPPPVVPMPFYPANPYQPGGYYQNGYNNPYQQNGGYNNPQNPYGQYNSQQYTGQNGYNPNRQGYGQPPQNNACNNQGYVQPPQNGTFTAGQTNSPSPFPDPTISPSAGEAEQNSVTASGLQSGLQNESQNELQNKGAFSEKTVVCPKCGGDNSNSSRFCTHCGQILK